MIGAGKLTNKLHFLLHVGMHVAVNKTNCGSHKL